eukprot:CFRG1134T1
MTTNQGSEEVTVDSDYMHPTQSIEATKQAEPTSPARPRQRLVIQKMVLENFKSYAGRVEVGPFHKCFSSVVGPNGSGKSNVIDSLLFVFGRRAKQIRQKRLAELIHNSDKFPNLDYCCVYIHFCEIVERDDDVVDVVPGTEMVVARKADKRNSSTYYLDGRVAKVEEVTRILKAKGIDLDHNRFLILQGEVESISMMKPKAKDENDEGLLEYLEDLIGSDVFKQPITDAADEAEKLNDVRQEKLNRVKAVGKEKERLQPHMQEAIKYIENCNARTDLQNHLIQVHKYRYAASRDAAEMERQKVDQQLQSQAESQKKEKAEMSTLEAQYEKEKAACEALAREVTKTKNEFASFERKDAKYREDLKHSNSKNKKLKSSLKEDETAINTQKHHIENANELIHKYRTEIEKDQACLLKEEAVLSKIEELFVEKTAELRVELERKRKDLQPWNRKLNELQSEYDLTNSELGIASGRHKIAQEKLRDAKERLANTSSNLSERNTAIKTMRVRGRECEEQLYEATDTLTKLESEYQQLGDNIRKDKGELEGFRSSLRESSDRDRVVDGLLAQKVNGTIPGIIGPLGSLGTIPDQYDVAITTACGALGHIVVDTVATGQRCTEYLRSAQLGRATFLILEKQQHLVSKMYLPMKIPEGVPRLFDLVNPLHETYLPAFYFALRNTLVANDLPQATRIANVGRTQHRVVTLNGELIDASGTMSGGGTRVKKGGMKSKIAPDVSPAVVEKKQQAIQQMEKQHEAMHQKIEDLKSTIARLTEEKNELLVGIEHAAMDIEAIQKQAAELPSLCETLSSQVKQTPQEKQREKELSQKLKTMEHELEQARTNVTKLDGEIKESQDQILDVGGVRMKAQKAKVDGILHEIDAKNSYVTKAQVAIKSATKKIETISKKIAKTEAEILENKAVIASMESEFAKLDQDAARVIDAMEIAQQHMNAKEESLEALTKEYEDKKAIYSKIRSVEVDLQNSLEDWTKQVRDSSAKIRRAEAELYELRLLPGVNESADLKLKEYAADELNIVGEPEELEMRKSIEKLDRILKNSNPNLSVVAEFQRKSAEYDERVVDLEAVTEQRDAARTNHESLRKKRLDVFMDGYNIVTLKLKEMYQMITLGGDAELELVDSLDPFSEGIVFSVRPPKKSWKNISNLSGGEKTLSSLALVFALHHYKPTPLYVMDEIDAALDFRNVSIVANYIKERTKNAQFIIISLRSNMFELADRLVGIYKTENHTKTAVINPASFNIAA